MPSIFDEDRCGIPAIPPIEELPFIDDCSVPAPPAIFVDCPDVDIPLPGVDGAPGGPGRVGNVGPAGPDGRDGLEIPGAPGLDGTDGLDGCEPSVTVSATVVLVYDPNDVEVTISVSSSPCNTHLTFTFYVYEPPPDPCSYWVWCCTTFENNPCCSGEWRLRSGPGGTPPCSSGCCHGQVRVLCPGCDSSSSGSSSSSSRGSGGDCVGCPAGKAPDAVTVTFSGDFETIETPDDPYDGACAQATCLAFFTGRTFVLERVEPDDDPTLACSYCGVFSGACADWILRVTLSASGPLLLVDSGTIGAAGDCTDFSYDGEERIYFSPDPARDPAGPDYDCQTATNMKMIIVPFDVFGIWHREHFCEWVGGSNDDVTATVAPMA